MTLNKVLDAFFAYDHAREEVRRAPDDTDECRYAVGAAADAYAHLRDVCQQARISPTDTGEISGSLMEAA